MANQESFGREPGIPGDIKAGLLSTTSFWAMFKAERTLKVQVVVIAFVCLLAAFRPLVGWTPFGCLSWILIVIVGLGWLKAEADNTVHEGILNASVDDPKKYNKKLGSLKDLAAAPVFVAWLRAFAVYIILMIHPL